MARTTVPVNVVGYGAGTAEGAGTTADVANGMQVSLKGVKTRKVFFRVTNTAGSTPTVTVRQGAAKIGSPDHAAWKSYAGDLVLAAAASGSIVFTIDPARHMQDDQTIQLDFSAGFVGAVFAYTLPPQA